MPPDRIRSSRSSISLHVYPHLTLSYNNTHQSSSLPTMPPDRIHSSRSSIAFHDLSSSHPALQQHSSVQVITSYNYQVRFPDSSPCTVLLPIPQSQSFTNHATRPNPLLSFINRLPRSILISPCLTTTLISPVHHQPRHQIESAPLVHQSPSTFYSHFTLSYNNTHQSSSSLPTITRFAFPTGPSALLSFLFPKTSPSPTTPPNRIRSSRSSISLHVLSSSHPVLQQHSSIQFITNHATR